MAEFRSKEAKRRRRRNRREAERNATPPWTNRRELDELRKEARRLTKETGTLYTLDHIVPLRHPLVCGLNCPDNIRIVPFLENNKKGNDFEPGRC